MGKELINIPEEKNAELVAGMFNSIAGRYDFLNHFLSLNIDKFWRKKAIQHLIKNAPETILDLATGTGDLAIASLRLNPKRVVGIDISEKMLLLGKEKTSKIPDGARIEFVLAHAEKIPFRDASFHAVISGFGVRKRDSGKLFGCLSPEDNWLFLNFQSLPLILPEMCTGFIFLKYFL
jgi:demethylmenaquinone methyltransferase/2-methoxy-6-polyprenyl-1,4-benzoquinol methylase